MPRNCNTDVGPAQTWFRALMPASAWWLTGVAAILMVLTVFHAAGDTGGDGGVLSAFLFPASVPTVWAVLQPIWTRYRDVPSIYMSLRRTLFVPLIVGPIVAIVGAITVMTPAVTDTIAATTGPGGFHHYFAERDGYPLVQVLILGGLANTFIAMLIGLALSVFVVLPWFAFARPREFMRANNYDDSDEAAPANTIASRTFAVLIMLVFAVPTLIVYGSGEARADNLGELFGTWWRVFTDPEVYFGDFLWMLGVALIPLAVVATVITAAVQRRNTPTSAEPDH